MKRVVLHAAVVAVLVGAGMVLVQLLYPRSLALPRASVGGRAVSWRQRTQIAADVAALNQAEWRVGVGEQTVSQKPEALGIRLDGFASAEAATSYTWRERLVPFSLLFMRREVPDLSYDLDQTRARAFAEELTQYNRSPTNAALKLMGTEVKVEQAHDGFVFEPAAVLAQLRSLELTQTMTMTLEPKIIPPDISDATALEAAQILQRRMQQPLVVHSGEHSITFDSTTQATWTVLTMDTANKTYHIGYDREKVKESLAAFAPQVHRAAVPSDVVTLDGAVIRTNGGAPGQGLNPDASADAVIAAINEGKPRAEAVLQPLIVVARATHMYTRSSKGVQALLDHWVSGRSAQYGIVFRSLDGSVVASHQSGRQFRTASIYKAYIAYAVHAKGLNMGAVTATGQTVAGCLDSMIIYSSNSCGEALGNMVGWSATDGLLRAKGLKATVLAGDFPRTTAEDAAQYLVLLQSGSLATPEYTDRILALFARQKYRTGIPAGTPGLRVANKVGFYDGYNHDIAIIYHPKGTYVLAVLSRGGNSSQFSDLARRIADVMNQ